MTPNPTKNVCCPRCDKARPENIEFGLWERYCGNKNCTCHSIPKDSWVEEIIAGFLKLHYEPQHEEGGVCWCGVVYKKQGKETHIWHNEQRDILDDFLRTSLTAHNKQVRERVEWQRKQFNRPQDELVGNDLQQHIGAIEACNRILSLLEE